MLEVQKMALERALKTLESVKDHIQYAVEYDGVVVGNRELKPAKKVKAAAKRVGHYPFGATKEYFTPYIKDMKAGDVVSIPWGSFDGAILARNVSAACIHRFGKGNATVHNNRNTKAVEVLIVGGDDTSGEESQIEMFPNTSSAN